MPKAVKRRNQIEAVLANVLRTYVAVILGRIQRSGADAITNGDTERNTNPRAKSIDAGATPELADNF